MNNSVDKRCCLGVFSTTAGSICIGLVEVIFLLLLAFESFTFYVFDGYLYFSIYFEGKGTQIIVVCMAFVIVSLFIVGLLFGGILKKKHK